MKYTLSFLLCVFVCVCILCSCVQLEVATKRGADVVLNPTKCDVVKEVKALSEGYGCDVYIEATGHHRGGLLVTQGQSDRDEFHRGGLLAV